MPRLSCSGGRGASHRDGCRGIAKAARADNRCALPDVVADIVRVVLGHHLDVAAAGGPDGAANAVPGVTEATAMGPNGVGDASHFVAPDALWSRRRNTSCRPHRAQTVTPTTGHLSSRRQAHRSWKQLAASIAEILTRC